jgi:oligosaccharide amylase
MAKYTTLGNGHALVTLDRNSMVRDLYYPYVGLENHVGGRYAHLIGVLVDGRFSWLNDGSWNIQNDNSDESFSNCVKADNQSIGVRLSLTDVVYNEKNIFARQVTVKNMGGTARQIKVFFNQQFEFYASHSAHTAFFDPLGNVIIHYRNHRAFLVNAQINGRGFDDYSCGIFAAEGKEGTHIDAQDGNLSRNPIEHGQADSCLGITDHYEPEEEKTIYYWIAMGKSIQEVKELDQYVREVGAEHIIRTTRDYWHAWVNRQNYTYHGLSEGVVTLFKKSLFVIKAHVDSEGGIIASGDSSMLKYGKDTYAYVWPRDAAYIAKALDKEGDHMAVKKFFRFCNDVIADEGYFLHKYGPDKSLGSSWHGWLVDNNVQLPIQEDETAVVLHVLWKHYEITRDLELIEELYNSLIKKAAGFMADYRDQRTGLPMPSHDLWEEKFGVHTYTASSVYAALIAAGRFAALLGKHKSEKRFFDAAREIREGIFAHLYNEETGVFYKRIIISDGENYTVDDTLDVSSFYGLYEFGVLGINDEKLLRFKDILKRDLSCASPVRGIFRYKGDNYFRESGYSENPWIITTLWLAQHRIDTAENESDLQEAKTWLEWAVEHATPSGILSEQIHPVNGTPLSACPLVWSHSEFVTTVINYIRKVDDLGIAKASSPVG